jgi:hypothetical protein
MDDEIYVVKIIVIVFSQSVRNNFKREETKNVETIT